MKLEAWRRWGLEFQRIRRNLQWPRACWWKASTCPETPFHSWFRLGKWARLPSSSCSLNEKVELTVTSLSSLHVTGCGATGNEQRLLCVSHQGEEAQGKAEKARSRRGTCCLQLGKEVSTDLQVALGPLSWHYKRTGFKDRDRNMSYGLSHLAVPPICQRMDPIWKDYRKEHFPPQNLSASYKT